MEAIDRELLTDPKESERNIFPIKYSDIFNEYTLHEAAHWTDSEVPYSTDLPDWNDEKKMSQDSKHFISHILAFFAGSDKIVNEKESKDNAIITVPECSFFIASKIHRENIHTLTYLKHLETLITDSKEREKYLNAVVHFPTIKNKAEWCRKYINDGSFTERQIAFAITEGLFFSSSFCAIFWLKKRGVMPALCFSNELISKDEGCHRDFQCLLYRKYIKNKLSLDKIVDMIKTAVSLEQEFVRDSLPVALIGMNSDEMCKYVEYVANLLFLNLTGSKEKIYKVENPFPWMMLIDVNNKTNFFEKTVSNYMDSGSLVSKEDNMVRFDVEF